MNDLIDWENNLDADGEEWKRIQKARRDRGEPDFWTLERLASFNKIYQMKEQIHKVIKMDKIDVGSDYHRKLCLLVRYRNDNPHPQQDTVHHGYFYEDYVKERLQWRVQREREQHARQQEPSLTSEDEEEDESDDDEDQDGSSEAVGETPRFAPPGDVTLNDSTAFVVAKAKRSLL